MSRHHIKKQLPDGMERGRWDHVVAKLLGPRLVTDDPENRKRQALELAAAALRSAGEHAMAASILDGQDCKFS